MSGVLRAAEYVAGLPRTVRVRMWCAEKIVALNDVAGRVLRRPSRTQWFYNAPTILPGARWARSLLADEYERFRAARATTTGIFTDMGE